MFDLLTAFGGGLDGVIVLFLAFVSFFASLLTAVFGLGGGILMMVVLSYFVPVAASVPVHGVVQLGSNAGRAALQIRYVQWQVVWPFLGGAFIGSALASVTLVQLPDWVLLGALGVFVLTTLWVEIPALSNPSSRSYLVGGGLSTFCTFFVGATGPLIASLLRQGPFSRFEKVASHAFLMTIQHGLKLVVFGILGFQFGQWVGLIVLLVVAGFLGTTMGTRLLGRISAKLFEQGVKWILTLLALDMLRRAVVIWLQAA